MMMMTMTMTTTMMMVVVMMMMTVMNDGAAVRSNVFLFNMLSQAMTCTVILCDSKQRSRYLQQDDRLKWIIVCV